MQKVMRRGGRQVEKCRAGYQSGTNLLILLLAGRERMKRAAAGWGRRMKRAAAPAGRTRRGVRCSSTEEQGGSSSCCRPVPIGGKWPRPAGVRSSPWPAGIRSFCFLWIDFCSCIGPALSLRPAHASFPLPARAPRAFLPASCAIFTSLAPFFFDSTPIEHCRVRRQPPWRAQWLIEPLPLNETLCQCLAFNQD
jgi:hypothetical protein